MTVRPEANAVATKVWRAEKPSLFFHGATFVILSKYKNLRVQLPNRAEQRCHQRYALRASVGKLTANAVATMWPDTNASQNNGIPALPR